MAAKKKTTPAPVKRKRIFPSGRTVLGIGLFLLVAGLVAATPFALHRTRHALRSVLHDGKAPALIANPSPEWIKRDLVAEAKAKLAKIASERTVTATDVGQAFDESPWIRTVRIKRTANGFQVDADYRQPILGVALKAGCCFTDSEGVALDPNSLTDAGGAACLTVRGIDVASEPRTGHRLDNPLVTRVGQLADLLWTLREPLELDVIIVHPHEGTNPTTFELRTLAGGRIVWGDFGAQDAQKRAQLVERAKKKSRLVRGETLNLTPVAAAAVLPRESSR